MSIIEVIGQIPDYKLKGIDSLLESHNGNNPGCVVGIIHNQELVYEKGFGKANLDGSRSFTSKSPFYIASMSKQFIAAGIGILAIEEKLNLDDEIYKYLPELSGYKVKITIRNLINHTSGIKDYSNLMFMRGDFYEDFIPLKLAIELLSQQSNLNFIPKKQYSYSNSNYLLLAEIISRISKMDFREFIQQEVFQPLDMHNTTFTDSTSRQANSQVLGYFRDGNGTYKPFTNYPPAAQDQIITTIQDFYLWDQNFVSKKVGGDKLQHMMMQKGKLSNGQTNDYSFGLHVENYRGLKTIFHGGYFRGYDSHYLQFPEENLSIIVFANSPNVNAYQTAYKIIDILFNKRLDEPQKKPVLKSLPSIKISNRELEKYSGSYWYKEIGKGRVIYLRNDTLRYNRPNNYESPIVPVGKDHFRRLNATNEQTANIVFKFSSNGNKTMIINSLENDSLIMEEYIVPNYSRKLFKKILGKYYCEDLDIEYELKLDKGLIRVWLNDRVRSRLVIQKEDLFRDYYFGTFRFVRDELLNIEGFYLSTDRAKNLFFKKVKD